MISVAKRVQRFSLRGNGISVIASRTELLPEDWSPETTSWGCWTMPLRPLRRSLSTLSTILRESGPWRVSRDVVPMVWGLLTLLETGLMLSLSPLMASLVLSGAMLMVTGMIEYNSARSIGKKC